MPPETENIYSDTCTGISPAVAPNSGFSVRGETMGRINYRVEENYRKMAEKS
jgi:hypothetical protein